MFCEYDVVRLKHRIPAGTLPSWPGTEDNDLEAGSEGTVVMVYQNGPDDIAYEVEFVDEDGYTTGLLTLREFDLELVQRPGTTAQ